MFSSCFYFELFLSGVVLSFRGIMASASNNKEKMPSEDDHQDPKLKEEVESEAEEEEIEEEHRSCTRTVVASIGVVTNPSKFKRSAWITTGGGVPRHTLAPRTSCSVQGKKALSVKKDGEIIPRAGILHPICS
jgi:hypothetical protein